MPQQRQNQVRNQAPPPAVQQNGQAVGQPKDALASAGMDPNQPLAMQMLTNPELRETVQWLCNSFANSPTAAPHVRGNPGLVLWSLDLARNTGLSPMYIMNCIADPGNGRYIFMAEIVVAALHSKKAIKGDLIWEEVGDWAENVQGKFAMVESQNKKGKKYAKATYTPKDEKGLGMKVTVHWVDREKPNTYGPYWLADMHPRFSTEWATDPRQQMKNRVIRRVASKERPDLLHGMPIDEEGHPEFHGPENAKPINETPKDKLDGFAEKQRAKRGQRSQAKTVDAEVIKDEPKPDTERKQDPGPDSAEDGPPWGEGEDDGMSSPCEPDPSHEEQEEADGPQADDIVKVWLNADETEYPIVFHKLQACIIRAMQKATSTQAVLKLYNNNAKAIALLDEEARAEIKDLMDERARILEE